MYRYLYLALILGVSQTGAFECGEGDGWTAIGQRATASVVQVLAYGANFSWLEPHNAHSIFSASGTAFFIDAEALFGDRKQRYLLTNYHVIDGAKAVYVTLPRFGKKRFSVVVEGICPEWDIALLRLTEESREYIERIIGQVQPLSLGDV